MTKGQLNGFSVQVYDSIDELPVERYHQFNRLLLIEASVGSDLASYDRHLSRLIHYVKQGDKEKAGREIENMRQNINFIFEGVSPEMTSFVPLIHSINGQKVEDISPEACEEILQRLGGGPGASGKIRQYVTSVKKKLIRRWWSFFLVWYKRQKAKL